MTVDEEKQATIEMETAIVRGDFSGIRELLRQGADTNEVGALNTAIRTGQTDIIGLLLDKGADPNKCNAPEKALSRKDEKIQDILLEKGAYTKTVLGYVLRYAALKGDINTVKEQLEKGAVERMNDALENAASCGHTIIAKLLLDKGANPHRAFCNAVTNGHTDIVKLILDKGADPNEFDVLRTAVICGHTDIVKLFLDMGADPNEFHVFRTAVICGHTDIVKLFLDKGADPNEVDALDTAVTCGHTCIVRLLLDKGADPNKVDALDTAVRYGHTDIVRLLLDKGADPNKHRAFCNAVTNGHTDIVKLFLDNGADPHEFDVLRTAVTCAHTDIVKLFLDKGADPNEVDTLSLNKAIILGQTEIVRLLLDKGAYLNKNDALNMAVIWDQTDIVRLLLDKGADPNKFGILHTAVESGNTDIVKLLLDKEEDPKQLGIFLMAVRHGHTDIVKLLLDRGADPNQNDAWFAAEQFRHLDVIALLKKWRKKKSEDIDNTPMQEKDIPSSTAVSPAKPILEEDIASPTAMPSAKPMQKEDIASSTAMSPAQPMQEEDVVSSPAVPSAKPMQKEDFASSTAVPPAKPMPEEDIASSTAVPPAKPMQKEGSVSSTAMPLQVAETDTEWIETVIKKQSIDDLKILEKNYTTDEINSFALPHFVAVYGSTEMIECMTEWKWINWNEQCEFAGNKFGESLKGIGVSKATALYLATFLDRKDIVRSLIKFAEYDNITQCLKNLDLSIEMEDVFMITLAEKLKDKHCELKPAVIPGHLVEGGGKRSRVFIVYSTQVSKASDYDLDGIASVMIRNPYMFVKENGCNAEAQIRLSDADSKRAEKALSIHRENLWERHSNLNIISASAVIHRGTHVIDKPCIVLYCSTKGVVPLGEPEFPKQLDIGEGNSIDVDVHEGYFIRGGYNSLPSIVHHDTLKMGCNIGRLTPEYDAHGNLLQKIGGTHGPFVKFNNKIGFLTCAHVLFEITPTSQSLYFQHTGHTKIEVVQPSSDATTSTGIACGHVDRAVFDPQLDPSVDAAVVELTDYNRIPRNGRFSNSTHSSYKDAGFQELPEFNSGSVQTNLKHFCGTHTVVKFGSASDVTRGALAVCGVDVRLMTTTLGLPRSTGRVEMINQLQVSGANPSMNFFQNGDSGSAVFMTTPGTTELHLIGMAIGSTYTGTNPFPVAVVTPIGDILKALGPDISIASFP